MKNLIALFLCSFILFILPTLAYADGGVDSLEGYFAVIDFEGLDCGTKHVEFLELGELYNGFNDYRYKIHFGESDVTLYDENIPFNKIAKQNKYVYIHKGVSYYSDKNFENKIGIFESDYMVDEAYELGDISSNNNDTAFMLQYSDDFVFVKPEECLVGRQKSMVIVPSNTCYYNDKELINNIGTTNEEIMSDAFIYSNVIIMSINNKLVFFDINDIYENKIIFRYRFLKGTPYYTEPNSTKNALKFDNTFVLDFNKNDNEYEVYSSGYQICIKDSQKSIFIDKKYDAEIEDKAVFVPKNTKYYLDINDNSNYLEFDEAEKFEEHYTLGNDIVAVEYDEKYCYLNKADVFIADYSACVFIQGTPYYAEPNSSKNDIELKTTIEFSAWNKSLFSNATQMCFQYTNGYIFIDKKWRAQVHDENIVILKNSKFYLDITTDNPKYLKFDKDAVFPKYYELNDVIVVEDNKEYRCLNKNEVFIQKFYKSLFLPGTPYSTKSNSNKNTQKTKEMVYDYTYSNGSQSCTVYNNGYVFIDEKYCAGIHSKDIVIPPKSKFYFDITCNDSKYSVFEKMVNLEEYYTLGDDIIAVKYNEKYYFVNKKDVYIYKSKYGYLLQGTPYYTEHNSTKNALRLQETIKLSSINSEVYSNDSQICFEYSNGYIFVENKYCASSGYRAIVIPKNTNYYLDRTNVDYLKFDKSVKFEEYYTFGRDIIAVNYNDEYRYVNKSDVFDMISRQKNIFEQVPYYDDSSLSNKLGYLDSGLVIDEYYKKMFVNSNDIMIVEYNGDFVFVNLNGLENVSDTELIGNKKANNTSLELQKEEVQGSATSINNNVIKEKSNSIKSFYDFILKMLFEIIRQGTWNIYIKK